MNTEAIDQPTTVPAAAEPGLEQTVSRLAHELAQAHYPNADRAALKRWTPSAPLPLAYYRLWLQHLRTEPPSEQQTLDWMAIVWGLALSGSKAHQAQRALGEALAQSGFAQARLERLLSAPEALRFDFYQSAVRFLAAKSEGCNWADWAFYLLTRDPEKRESLHRRIALSYYRHLPSPSGTEN